MILKQTLKEDGGGAVNAAGTGGFSNSASAAGPVAGYDPIIGMRSSMKKRVKKFVLKRAAPPNTRGIPFDSGGPGVGA